MLTHVQYLTFDHFSRYDTNNNGVWSKPEFAVYEANFTDAGATFETIDTSNGGVISSSEFVVFYRAGRTFDEYNQESDGAMTQSNWTNYATDWQVPTSCDFSSVDTNNNGVVSRFEYFVSVYSTGCSPSVRGLFRKFDTNSDGRWSPAEYDAYSKEWSGCTLPTDTPCPFAITDKTNDGYMSEDEFVSAATSYAQFSEFDEDGDLELAPAEWTAYNNKYGGSRRQGRTFQSVDKNKDGVCEYCEEVLGAVDESSFRKDWRSLVAFDLCAFEAKCPGPSGELICTTDREIESWGPFSGGCLARGEATCWTLSSYTPGVTSSDPGTWTMGWRYANGAWTYESSSQTLPSLSACRTSFRPGKVFERRSINILVHHRNILMLILLMMCEENSSSLAFDVQSRWVIAGALNAEWTSSQLPKFSLGPTSVSFKREASQFLDAGWMELKIATLGGFSIMWYGRFTEVLKLRHKSALPIPTYTCLHLRSCWHVKQTLVTLLISTRHPDTQSD